MILKNIFNLIFFIFLTINYVNTQCSNGGTLSNNACYLKSVSSIGTITCLAGTNSWSTLVRSGAVSCPSGSKAQYAGARTFTIGSDNRLRWCDCINEVDVGGFTAESYWNSVANCGNDLQTTIYDIYFSYTNRYLVVSDCSTGWGWYVAEASPTASATAATKNKCKGTISTLSAIEIFTVVCANGYTGSGGSCTDINECTSGTSSCSNGCVNTAGSYYCTCPSGYQLDGTGKKCADINECSSSNGGCSNGCVNTVGSFYCTCPSGYQLDGTGKKCVDINECSSSNGGCSNGCVNTAGSYYCTCPSGYQLDGTNKKCVDINECSSSNGGCSDGCVNTAGSYYCTCPSGYQLDGTNKKCVDINECSSSNGGCSDGCVNTAGSYYCTCPSGYQLDGTNKKCVDTNECSSNNGGCSDGCVNTAGSYYCTCPSGYQLDGTNKKCVDINECSSSNGGCSDGCVNTAGSYYCTCPSGYQLDNTNKKCVDINECSSSNGGCSNGCVNTVGSYYCTCPSGYQLDNTNKICIDINECSTGNGGCSQNCINSLGSYSCSCNGGYILNSDGKGCNDINECNSNNGGCSNGCVNIIGSYYCTCPSGYELDDTNKKCIDIDECKLNIDSCTGVASCSNTQGSYICNCPNGYDKSGQYNCVDINECLSDESCISPATCTNTIGSYFCLCDVQGFELDSNGTKCIDVNECDRKLDDCVQICENVEGNFECKCNSGYRLNSDGRSCNDIDECQEKIDLCVSPATCQNDIGTYNCDCSVQGYELDSNGTKCIDVNECDRKLDDCEQICVNVEGDFRCKCNPGYLLNKDGRTCDDIDECLQEDNGGCNQICHNTIGNNYCTCENGYYLAEDGKTCLDIDECLIENGNCDHICINTISSYYCKCNTNGFELQNNTKCIDIDECLSDELNQCIDGTVCLNNIGDYSCECFENYTRYDEFKCIPKPIITNFYQKPIERNQFIVQGFNFIGPLTITFINNIIECNYIEGNSTYYECYTQENIEIRGNITVECNDLISDEYYFIGSPFLINYTNKPSTIGNDHVTIYGRNFPTIGNCILKVNDIKQNIIEIQQELIIFNITSGTGKNNIISISNETVISTNILPIQYKNPIIRNTSQVESITGGLLTIYGDNFGDDSSLVNINIGNIECTDIEIIVDHKELTCYLKPQFGYIYTQIIELEVDLLPVENDYYFTYSFIKETGNCPLNCSSNGQCTEFGCVCNQNYTGVACNETVVEIITKPPIIDIPTIEIGKNDTTNNQFGYNISIIRIEELSLNETITSQYQLLNEKWTLKTNETNKWVYNITLSNESILETTFEIFNEPTLIEFASNLFTIQGNSLKVTIIVKSWPFISKLNTLRVVIESKSFSNGGKSCSIDKSIINSYNQHLWTTTKNEESGLISKFISIAEIDNKISITPKIETIELSKTNSIIGISVPYFKNQSILDPDFSILLNVNNQKTGNCIEVNKVNWRIATGTAIGAAGFVCLTTSIFYLVSKRRKEKEINKALKDAAARNRTMQ